MVCKIGRYLAFFAFSGSLWPQLPPQHATATIGRDAAATIQNSSASLAAPQEIFDGLWRIDRGFTSIIQIKNTLTTGPMDVTPVVYMADGKEYVMPVAHLDTAAVETLNVKRMITQFVPDRAVGHLSRHGSVSLRFNGTSKAILASMVITNEKASLSYLSQFSAPAVGLDAPKTLEGLWWKRDLKVGGFIALSNSTDAEITATLKVTGAEGTDLPVESHLLPPHATEMLDFRNMTYGLPDSESQQGGLQLKFKGHVGDVNIVGGLENGSVGYSAIMPFWIATTESSSEKSTLAHVGIMVSTPDKMMRFPEEGVKHFV